MAFSLYKDPIVREKPARGREMQTKVIPKDMVETLAPTAHPDAAEDGAEGKAELFYEGYIDGKRYLVPDSNLEAMKDMINLKMRRMNSSFTKPRTSMDEPTQYSEFESKLDDLLKKVDDLAKESELSLQLDVVSENSSFRSTKGKSGKGKKSSKTVVKPEVVTLEEPKVAVKVESKHEEICPPLLDKNIKYKRVRPKDPSKREYIRELIQLKQENNIIQISGIPASQTTTEKFRLLISGHLKDGYTPIFIIHQNYTGPNILENVKMDFESFQKQGNIDIFISGKFFTDAILKEETPESPALINVDSRQILIDKLSNIHSLKFKDVYSLGPVDVGLEGEFIRDKSSSKFTPALSLEIVRMPFAEESFEGTPFSQRDVAPLTLMQTQEDKYSPFRKNKTKPTLIPDKRHVTCDDETLIVQIIPEKKSNFKPVLDKLKNSYLFRKMFSKKPKVEDMSSDRSNLQNESSYKDVRGSKGTKGRQKIAESKEKSIVSRLFLKRNKENPTKKTKKEIDFLEPVPSTSASIYEQRAANPLADTEDSINLSKAKKHKKLKRGKKNQAIVENPILAQMQEFFIA